jgi:hypothetical protein
VRRLNIFAKGNVDVHDSLVCCTVGGTVQWNGINEVLRRRFPGHVARVRHETCTRFDALAAAGGSVPPELREGNLPLGPYPLESQFSRRVFTTPSDVVVLSILSDVMMTTARHRDAGYLLYCHGGGPLAPADRRWLDERFEPLSYLDVDTSMSYLARVCEDIHSCGGAHVLVYNVSAVVPGEQVHCYQGLTETLANRVRRFNLALVGLSERLGVSVVDVDAVVARGGADRLKLGPAHLTAEGHRLVAEEVVRILQDLGCFDKT